MPRAMLMNTYACVLLSAVFLAALQLDLHHACLARVRDPAHIASGFCSGTILGCAFFIFVSAAIPIDGSGGLEVVLSLSGLGFVLAMLSHRVLLIGRVRLMNSDSFLGRRLGRLGFAVALGCGFRLSPVCGSIITLAFVSRELCLALEVRPARGSTVEAVAVNVAAALVAVLVAQVIPPGFLHLQAALPIIGGIFVYFGASILIPESHHLHSQWPTLGTTVAGALLVYWGVR